MKRIFVLGSLNVDFVQRVPRMPALGETLEGENLEIFLGGKGANQACAAARLGGRVQMAGKVGGDAFGERLKRELESAGVDTRLVAQASSPSGTAMIFVLPNGENAIVISAGANAEVSVDFALHAIADAEAGDIVMAQLETPLESVEAAMKACFKKRVMTMLDPAPARPLGDDLLSCVSILTPNQTEAALLVGDRRVPGNASEAESAARTLQARGAHTVIVKMGSKGCIVATGTETHYKAGYRVDVKDTTAAGDTFNGALAAALARGASIDEAADFANAAAALSVTKIGASSSVPLFSEVEEFLRSGTPHRA